MAVPIAFPAAAASPASTGFRCAKGASPAAKNKVAGEKAVCLPSIPLGFAHVAHPCRQPSRAYCPSPSKLTCRMLGSLAAAHSPVRLPKGNNLHSSHNAHSQMQRLALKADPAPSVLLPKLKVMQGRLCTATKCNLVFSCCCAIQQHAVLLTLRGDNPHTDLQLCDAVCDAMRSAVAVSQHAAQMPHAAHDFPTFLRVPPAETIDMQCITMLPCQLCAGCSSKVCPCIL